MCVAVQKNIPLYENWMKKDFTGGPAESLERKRLVLEMAM